MTATATVDRRPTRSGAVGAVVVAAAAVAAVADGPPQLLALGVALGGITLFAMGAGISRRWGLLPGIPVVFAGAVAVAAALALGATRPSTFTEVVELLPGMLGVAVLAAGLVPVRAGWSRHLVTAGAALVAVTVLTSGVVHGTSKFPLLAGMAATVIAWDAGEQSISLGEQVGTGADSGGVELVHAAWSGVVGLVGVAAAVVVFEFDAGGIPLAGIAFLLAAAVLLVTALYT